MPGIHTPFTYIGKKNTTFGWHEEDGGVGSLNYLHRGKKNMNYFCSADTADKILAKYLSS